MYRKQEPPYAIQIVPTEGCSLACGFCAINGIREKPGNYKFMTKETMHNIARDIRTLGWNARIELAGSGEPSMHEDLAGLIRILRSYGLKNQIMVTSNGGGFLRKPGPVANIAALFDAGLTVLGLDDYGHARFVPRLREVRTELEKIAPCFDYPEDGSDASLHANTGKKRIVFVQDISVAVSGNHSKLSNQAGESGPRDRRMMGKPCAKVFRELTVRWDGAVAICCETFRGEYVIREGHEQETMRLGAVWQSDAFNAARQKLLRGERDFGPCDGCTSKSYRTGLLPDKYGKETLDPPDATTYAIIAQALSRGPLTKPVLRPWEIKDEGVHPEQGASGTSPDDQGVQSSPAG
jgi:hypothetical protein